MNSKELHAHVDLGTKSVGTHWFNPYLVFKTPRSTSGGNWLQSGTFGALFHYNPLPLAYWVRYHSDLTLTPALDGQKNTDRPEIQIRQNFLTGWNRFLFGIHETWTFRHGFKRTARFSAAVTDPKFNAFLELDVKDPLDFVTVTGGGWYQVVPEAKVYGQISKNLPKKQWDLGAGVDLAHSSGVGVKLGYFHNQKIASAFSFKLNKYFSGSLLFDVSTSNDRNCSQRLTPPKRTNSLGEPN